MNGRRWVSSSDSRMTRRLTHDTTPNWRDTASPPRRQLPWHCRRAAAHAFLAVVRAAEHAREPAPDGLIPLTCNEIHRPFTTLVGRPEHAVAHRLGWSDWRRRHQARARASHYRRQTATQT